MKSTEQARIAARRTVTKLSDDARNTTKPFDRKAFKDRLTGVINEEMTQARSKEEAEKVMNKGAANASATLGQGLKQENDAAAGGLPAAADHKNDAAPGDQTVADTPALQPEASGPAPAPVDSTPAVPPPLPAQQLDYSADRGPTDQAMAESHVTTEQMQEGNDPAFGPVLSERANAERHEAEAAGTYRQDEAKIRAGAAGHAQAAVRAGLSGMHGVRGRELGKVAGQQQGVRATDTLKRTQIMTRITQIKSETQAAVKGILDDMEREASRMFTDGLKNASDRYEAEFSDVKGGVKNWLTNWGDDWKELIERALASARGIYRVLVSITIDDVATYVERQINAAKERAALGERQANEVVDSLGGEMSEFAAQARESIATDFGALQGQIDERCEALINRMSEQLKASFEKMKAREEELREANKSLWERVYDATVGAIKKIIEFKNLLFSVLAKAAAVVLDIIAHPIRFLGNLVSAVGQGLKNFIKNIGTHLQKGLMDWLFGALAGAGLKLPEKFDLEGIVSIVLQILGLTYDNFRARAVNILGEPIVAALEKGAEVFMIFMREGVPGIWRFIKEKVSDLKAMVLDAIFDYIKEKVITAGITWIIGLLNPASAFFKACKAIYDIIVFIVNRASQIVTFVSAVVDSVAAIVAGNLGAAVAAVENALARAIPVAIGMLASLLGLGDPSKPVKETIEKAQSPINKAIDWVIHGAVKLVKAAGKLVTGVFGKKDRAKEEKNPHEGDPEKAAKIEAGLAALDTEDAARAKQGATHKDADAIAAKIKREHTVFNSIHVVAGKGTWDYRYAASPEETHVGPPSKDAPPKVDPVSEPDAFDMSKLKDGKSTAEKNAIEKEFISQVTMQQNTLNGMFVGRWEKNRKDFVKRAQTSGSGRHPDSGQEQKRFREAEKWQWVMKRAGEIAKSQGRSSATKADLAGAETAFEKESPLKGQVAAHVLDMVAGGEHNVFELAGYSVNSSLGPQWTAATRVGKLHADVDAFKAKVAKERGDALTQEELDEKVKMHVKLTWTG